MTIPPNKVQINERNVLRSSVKTANTFVNFALNLLLFYAKDIVLRRHNGDYYPPGNIQAQDSDFILDGAAAFMYSTRGRLCDLEILVSSISNLPQIPETRPADPKSCRSCWLTEGDSS